MFRVLLACLFLAACSSAKPPAPQLDPSVAPKYIGVLMLYVDGEYVKGIASNKTYVTTKECLDVANSVIAHAVANGDIPRNGSAIGACIPVPSLRKPLHLPPLDPKPTSEQGTL